MSATTSSVAVSVRTGTAEDAEACGRICYEAFATLAEQHGFPPDFPSVEAATGVVGMLLAHPGFHAVVAERDGHTVGSNFLDERGPIAGIGPITVDPQAQNAGIGRQLMLAVLARAREQDFAGVRLLQAAYHNRSLSLYAKLGFQPREPILNLDGQPLATQLSGHPVRAAGEADADACNRLCRAVHGHDRAGELTDALGHEYTSPGFLLPARNTPLVHWCLERGLRLRMVTTLMTIGLYNEPQGAYLPSIAY